MQPVALNPVQLKAYSSQLPARAVESSQPANMQQLEKSARDVEAFFISQMLEYAWDGVKTDGPMGGGNSEKIFRSFMIDEYGKKIAASGQLGISDAVLDQLVRYQEQANGVKK